MRFGRIGRVAVLLFFLVTGLRPTAAQEIGNLDVRLLRFIDNQQNIQHDSFFECLDHTSIPTFGAILVGFVVIGAVTRDRFIVETGIRTGLAQGTSWAVTVILMDLVGR